MTTSTKQDYKYHYGVLRYIPDIVREESVNVMIILWLPEQARVMAVRTTLERLYQAATFFRIQSDLMALLVPSLEQLCDKAAKMTQRDTGQVQRTTQFDSILTHLLPHDSSALQWSPHLGGGYDSLPEEGLLHRLATRYL